MESERAASHAPVQVRIAADGGVRMDDDVGSWTWVGDEVGGWDVSPPGTERRWRIAPVPAGASGVVLVDADGSPERELGRTTRPPTAAPGDGRATVLLADGRVFEIRPRVDRAARTELVGWEAPGAYLEAYPTDEGWTVRTTVAGWGLGREPTLLVLLVAELIFATRHGPE